MFGLNALFSIKLTPFIKEIEFISVHQFFKLHNDKFSNEERSYYYKLAEQQAASEDELANALLSKIKDNHSNEM